MARIARDSTISGVEDFFPDEVKSGIVELSRRLDKMVNSFIYQLRSNITVYTNVDADPPSGMEIGDVWVHRAGTVQVWDGSAWVP